MITLIDMPIWTGTIPQGPSLRQRATGKQCLLRDNQSLSGMSSHRRCSVLSDQPWTHIHSHKAK